MGRASTPLKVLSNGDLRAFTATEERYLAYLAGTHLGGITTSDVSALNITSGNTVGQHTNTVYDQAVAAHGDPLTTTTTNTILYQKTGTPDESSSRPIISWDYSRNGIKEMNSTELDVLVDRLLKIIMENEYPGVFRLASSTPGSDWSELAADIFTDTRTDGTSTTYSIWVRTTGQESNAPTSSDLPATLKRSGGSGGSYQGFQRGTASIIASTLGQRAKAKILSSGIGTYQLRSSAQGAPVSAGTWVARGTALDTRQQVVEETFEEPYTTTYTGEYNLQVTYQGNYEGDFTTFANYESTRGSVYTGDFTGDYVIGTSFEGNYINKSYEIYQSFVNRTDDYTTNYQGNFEGFINYVRVIIDIDVEEYTGGYVAEYLGFTNTTVDALEKYEQVYEGNYQITLDYTQEYLKDYLKDYTTNYQGNYTSLTDFISSATENIVENYENYVAYVDMGDQAGVNYEGNYTSLGGFINYVTPSEVTTSIDYTEEYASRLEYEGEARVSVTSTDYINDPIDYEVHYLGTYISSALTDLNYEGYEVFEAYVNPAQETYTGYSKGGDFLGNYIPNYIKTSYSDSVRAFVDQYGGQGNYEKDYEGQEYTGDYLKDYVRLVEFVGDYVSHYVSDSVVTYSAIKTDLNVSQYSAPTKTQNITTENRVNVQYSASSLTLGIETSETYYIEPVLADCTNCEPKYLGNSYSPGGTSLNLYTKKVTSSSSYTNPSFLVTMTFDASYVGAYQYKIRVLNSSGVVMGYFTTSGTASVPSPPQGSYVNNFIGNYGNYETPYIHSKQVSVGYVNYANPYEKVYTHNTSIVYTRDAFYVNYAEPYISTSYEEYEADIGVRELYIGPQDFVGEYLGTYETTFFAGSEIITSYYEGGYQGDTIYLKDYTKDYVSYVESTTPYTPNYLRQSTLDFSGEYTDEFVAEDSPYQGFINFVSSTTIFAGNYTRDYEGNYLGFADYVSSTDVNYGKDYEADYTKEYVGFATYTGSQTVGYEGNYTGDFTSARNYTNFVESVALEEYQGDFEGNYTNLTNYISSVDSTYTGDYSSLRDYINKSYEAYVGVYTNYLNYERNSTDDYGSEYVGDFEGGLNYTSTSINDRDSTIDYVSSADIVYVGNFLASTIQSSSETIETYTLYVRIA